MTNLIENIYDLPPREAVMLFTVMLSFDCVRGLDFQYFRSIEYCILTQMTLASMEWLL